MKVFKKMSLVTKIIIGLLIGALLGLYANYKDASYLSFISVFGNLYIGALKAMAPLLVFVLVIGFSILQI